MKVNRFLFLLFALFSFCWLQAGVVTEEQALQKAEQFLKGKKIKSRALARGKKKSGADFNNAFYVFNVENKGGFVIVSGDDRTPEILGYSTNGEMDLDDLPSNVKVWLNGYQKQIQALDRQKTSRTTRGGGDWTAVDQNNTLIKTKWGQGSPYNLKCPVLKNDEDQDQNCITGCVATAIAQIMNYWKCPADGYLRSLDAYDVQEWDDNINQNVTLFTVPAIDAITIDWNKLKTSYNYNETDEAAQEVAKLMRHVGQSEYMHYGLSSSGAYTAQGNWLQNFGYNKGTASFIDRDNYSSDEWDEIIYNEVSSGRPVLYNGYSNYGGHAFICDGYAGEGRFWINWGWDGYCDGQYLLSVLNDDYSGIGPNAGEADPGEGYNFYQGAYIGIQPAKGNEGNAFIAQSAEGQDLTFMISSDDDGNRTCVVGDGTNPAIDYNYEGALTIPSQVNFDNKTYDVVAINKEAFSDSQVTSVNLPATLKKLNNRSFAYCYNLTSLEIPSSVTEIGVGAIYYCYNLTSLTVESGNAKYTSANNAIIEGGTKIVLGCNGTSEIPGTVTEIGIGAFESLQNLTLTIPQTVTKIGERAFAYCYGCVFSVEYDTPLEIPDDTFKDVGNYNCILRVPTGKKSLYQAAQGWRAFGDKIVEGDEGTEFKAQVGGNEFDMLFTITGENTAKVGSLTANWETQAVDRVLFNGDNNIEPTQTAIIIPETVEYKGKAYTVTEIGDYAFRNIAFTTISLPSTLTKIGTWAFIDNWNVQELVIPKNVTEISEGAIFNCSNLTSLTVENGNLKYTSPNNNVLIENGTKIIAGLRTTTISNDITAIGANAFRCASNMTLTIPQTVTTIGEYAFAYCSNSVFTVENSTPLEIPYNTFNNVGNNGCVLKVPAGAKSAYQTAQGWRDFGDNIMEGDAGTEFKAQVGGNEFDMTFTITGSNTVKVGSLTANWETQAVDRVLFNGDNNIEPTQTAIIIPETVEYKSKAYTVTEIGDYAFRNIAFTTISLPSTLLKIGREAFATINDMAMTIPQTVTTIDEYAFAWCYNCVFTVENEMPIEINEYTFEETGNYSVLKVPTGSKSTYKAAQGWSAFGENILEGDEGTEFKAQVGGNAFDMTFTITGENTVKVGYMNPQWESQAVDRNLFNGEQPAQTAIIIPETVVYNNKEYTVNEISDYAFRSIYFKTISMPSTLTKIGTWVFVDNWEVKELVIPKNVTEIKEEAILNCNNLTSLTVEDGNEKYTSVNNAIIEDGTKIIAGITTTVIPDGITMIGAGAFRGLHGMNLTIPKAVISIGRFAFADCYNCIFTVEYENPLEIDEYTFVYAGDNNCILKVPAGAKSAYQTAQGWSAFGDNIMEGDEGTEFQEEVDNGLLMWFTIIGKNKVKVGHLTGNQGPAIDGDLFEWGPNGEPERTSVTIPKTVTHEGTTYKITAIGERAFSNIGMESITLPTTIREIGSYSFESCYNLKALVIPASVTSIKESAFAWCGSITSVKVASANEVYESPAGSNAIIEKASKTLICGFKNTIIPDNVTKIGPNAFRYIKDLKVTIPKSVKEIGYNAFTDCWGESVVTVEYTDLSEVTLGNDVFIGSAQNGMILIVPKGMKSTYLETDGWNMFPEENIREYEEKIVLDKTELAIAKGQTEVLTATCPPSWSDKSVTWESSDPTIVIVKAGKIKGMKVGTATITCTSVATGLTATCKVIVGYVKLSKTEVTVQKGEVVTLKSKVYPTTEDQAVTWKSSNTKIATVSDNGEVTGVKAGTATITCKSVATGLSTTCEVTVAYVKLSKTEVAIEKGKTLTLKSKVYPTTEDQSVTWESSNPTIVKVTASGKIGGLKVGTATITCTSVATGLSATCTVTVGYVKLSASELTIQKGDITKLKYKVYPTDLADQSVTWKSSDPTIVKVTASGKIGGIKAGTATITCTSNATGLSATCIVTVKAAANARSLNGEVTGIDDMDVDPVAVEPFDVYDLNGRKVLHQATSLDALPNGVYIVNGRKVFKKD